jgi:ubiquinone/menaquinone biosynthesis C-methylase UbiE
MKPIEDSKPQWGASYRLIAAEKWKAKSAAMGQPATDALVKYARPQPGMSVLDLATGTGEPGISLAGIVGPQGRVTAVDLSAELLEIAQRRAQQRQLSNFVTRQADAQRLPFPENSFDLATCRFGVMFFADTDKALKEVKRVLRPQARACFLAWGPFEQPYWASTMGIVAKHAGGPAISPGSENPFKFAAKGNLSTALRQAGFSGAEEETRTVPWSWPGPVEEVWDYARSVSVPFRALLERVRPDRWDEVNAEVYAAAREYCNGNRVDFGAVVVIASGKKP